MLSGLDRVNLLPSGHGFFNATAGVNDAFGSGLGAFAEAELGFKPRDNVDLFAFGKATLVGVQAGVGARVTF